MAEETPRMEIELIIKASTIDGRRKGACLFCHEFFMNLYLLAEIRTISLSITTVDTLKPPSDFRAKFEASPPPILVAGEEVILENEQIERFIMKRIPGGHNLFVNDKDVGTLISNVYGKFKLMMVKKDEPSKKALVNQLKKIDEYLAKTGMRFLTGDSLCSFDCELMPRLQHVRVAGAYYANFEIPTDLKHIWFYIYHMYYVDAFTQSCPADQDLISHYAGQQTLKMTKLEKLSTPTYNTTIPEVIVAEIESLRSNQ